jgi:signal transduction histidine kinase/DNA-binding response OmpR family regulator
MTSLTWPILRLALPANAVPGERAARGLIGACLVLSIIALMSAAVAIWRRQAVLLGVESGVTVLALLVLFGLLAAQFRRLARSEAVLAQHNTALEANATKLAGQTAELQETAEALRRSEGESAEKSRLLETTLEAMTQGIIMVTADGMVVVCNARAVALLDLPDWLVGKQFRFADLVAWQWSSGEFANADPAMADMLRNIRPGEHPQVYVRRRPNGTVLEIRSMKLPDGSTVRTYSDITAHKEAEERADAARAQAEQANRAKSDFLANISHEIRTPMNGVIGMNEVLMRTDLTDAQRECVQTIRVSAEALLAVINDVLDLSRLEAGKMDLERIPFDLMEIVDGAVALLRPRASEKGLTLSSTIAPSVARQVTGDPVRLRQVLLNLVGNAVKFTEAGSVALTLDLAPAGGVRICVCDTGIGMSPDTLQRLFQKFTQADNSISRRFGGSGLGLAISRELVTLMDGTIDVDSTLGRGSRFTVTLPLPPVPAAAATGGSPAPAPRGPVSRSLHVLVVDDNAINRRLVTVLLQDAGHRVDVATNGREAVEAAVSVRYDAILMDVQMPVMNGVQATRRIRALPPPFNAVPVIALTADALSDASQRYSEAGMDAYLSKPLSSAALTSTLDALANGGRPAPGYDTGRPLDGSTLAALRGFLQPQAFQNFIQESVADIEARLVQLEALLEAGNLRAAAQAAHDLVSIAGNCGAYTVSRMARDIEQACRDGSAAPRCADALRTAWGRAAQLLEAATAD